MGTFCMICRAARVTTGNLDDHTLTLNRLVVFLTGLARVSLPSSNAEAYILGGSENSLIVAADTTGNGHFTDYPSDAITTAIQLPLPGGLQSIPDFTILDDKEPCSEESQVVADHVP